jgi:hypothetical protein
MKKCCKQTYINTLEEIKGFILNIEMKSFVSLVATLDKAIKMVKEELDAKKKTKENKNV